MGYRKRRRTITDKQWGMRLTTERRALIQEAQRIVTALRGGRKTDTTKAVEASLRTGNAELQRRLDAGESFF